MTDRQVSKLAVIGAGKMGDTLISALLASDTLQPRDIVATAKHQKRIDELAARHGVAVTLDNRQAAQHAEVVLLAVKPQVAPEVLREVGSLLRPEQLLVSIIAGLTTDDLQTPLDEPVPVVRAMPNTPARIKCGMTSICAGRHASAEHVAQVEGLFAAVGRTLVLEEKHFNAVTGLGASGPAFVYIVIEALADGGVKVGLPRDVAIEIAAQACFGASRMVLDTGHHPALLKDEVTTPAGCTVDGILQLEEGGLRVTLIKAIVEASRRAEELVDG